MLRRVPQRISNPLADVPYSGETVVSLTFDDGWADQYTNARSILAAHRMQATFYVNSNRINTSGFLTWTQLEALHADGHEVGGHTLDHVDLTEVSAEEARRQVGDERAMLVRHGFRVRSFAYPYGAYNARAESIVQDCGYASGRAAWGLCNLDAASVDSRPAAGNIPPKDSYAVPTLCCIRSTTSLAALRDHIVRAENGPRSGWVPLVLHRVCDDGGDRPAQSIRPAMLDSLLDWLETRAANGTVVRTVADVIGNVAVTTAATASKAV
jgi:peptidoglycan/xylan/chitin deacetylase (PgdA/CDA1 family)